MFFFTSFLFLSSATHVDTIHVHTSTVHRPLTFISGKDPTKMKHMGTLINKWRNCFKRTQVQARVVMPAEEESSLHSDGTFPLVAVQLDCRLCPLSRKDATLRRCLFAHPDRLSIILAEFCWCWNPVRQRRELAVRRLWVKWPRHAPHTPPQPCVRPV